jgi:hypothetical protein
MQKLFRLSTLIVFLSFSLTPALRAERAGTNPHPATKAAEPLTTMQVITCTVISYFGL